VTCLVHLTPLDPRYPGRLRSLHEPPASITVRGGAIEASRAVAVVGSRDALPDALTFARDLAGALARAGVAVVSGGAEGVDCAAHEGALHAGGRTWAFAPAYQGRSGFLLRNRVLIALSDAVVVVQAGFPSGALQAASWAKKLQKPLWVVPAAPWMNGFAGSRQLLDEGARPLVSSAALLRALGIADSSSPASASNTSVALPEAARSEAATAIFAALSPSPSHADAIAARARLSAQVTTATLLTLALEDVVVEGPLGFFRRR
jgi:DNA processing protein